MDSPLHLTFHYPSFFQHLQVFGNGRLGRTELAAKFAGAASLALRQDMNHGTPGAVRQGVKGKIEGRTAIHSQLTIYWPDEISNTEIPQCEFRLRNGVTQNAGYCQLDLRESENTRTIHTHLFLLLPYKALRSDPCPVNTT